MAQPATQAFSSQGTKLEVKIASVYQEVYEVYGLDNTGGESEEIDVTTMGSPGNTREKVLGFRDSGQYDFELNHLPADPTHQYLETAYKDRTAEEFKITASDTGGETVEFTARVKKFARQYRTGEAAKVSVSLLLTGDYVVTP